MPRKRHHDLRDFWPWYERQWPTRYGLHATPPPFTLDEIRQAGKVSRTEKRIVRVAVICLLVLGVVVVLWGLFLA